MTTSAYLVAAALLATGLILGFRAQRQLTPEGLATPWYKRWRYDKGGLPLYSPNGRTLARLSSVSMCLGAFIYLAAIVIR